MDTLVGSALSGLLKLVIHVVKNTAAFKPELMLLRGNLETLTPIIVSIVKMNRELDRSDVECEMFNKKIEEAKELVLKCSKVKRNLIKKYDYSPDLKAFNDELVRFFQTQVQAIQARDIIETLYNVNNINLKIDTLILEFKDMKQRMDQWGCEMKRETYGWRVPALPSGIVAFDEPLAKLKAKVVAGIDIDVHDDDDDGNSVLVVAAAGGCGKTTLAKMLCHDTEIREHFGENIFFVTVSEKPNFMVIVSDLFNPNTFSQQPLFKSNSDEDAKNKLENFFNQKASDPMLLVLDDVWSHSFIEKIVPLKIKGHKILVTSRTAFPSLKCEVFTFDPLNDEDAKTVLCHSAFTGGRSRPAPPINDNLVNQMVQRCKKHPLTLLVVGGSLNGKGEVAWKAMLGKLSHGRFVVDLHKEVLIALERSFEALDDDNHKECFLDFGLFPEDQRIPVSALFNMWMHLYDHSDD